MTAAIQENPLFEGLSAGERHSLLVAGRLRRLGKGEILYTHGTPVQHFYLVEKGTLQLFRTTPDGRENTLGIATAGQPLGEDEIMDNCRHHRVNARAVEDSALLEFRAAWLKESASRYPAFALNLLSLIAARTHLAELEAEHQATLSAAQLVACFLQRVCILHDFDPRGFDLPYSKTLIASRLGMEAETFSRTLNKLKPHGIIVEGNHVAITNLGQIADYVCAFCSVSGDCPTHHALEAATRKLP